ncbi:MAG: TonB-dependent receptor [Bacteroidales bacterium]|nr:TonB-dependent receptor [Bacteroidales bacterium]
MKILNMRYLKTALLIFICLGTLDSLAQIKMTGKITDSNNEPLIGAILSIDGTEFGGLSDLNGNYRLNVPQKYENEKIVISYVGYSNDTIPVKAGNLDIVLPIKALEQRNTITYVTTQKRLQTNLEVPITLSVLEDSKLDKLIINDPQELSLFTPGYHNQTQSCVYSVNVIRGVASDGSNSYSFFQPRISVFLDGVSVTHMGTASSDIFDMQRAEIVKGPQGTLFGKGAEFGAVSYVTNKPIDNFEANIQMSYGSYKQKIVQGMINTPINEKIANRFAFYYNERDGYNTNLYDNSDLSGKGAISVRDILKWKPNENLTMHLSADYEHNDEPCVSYKGNIIGTLNNELDISPYTSAYFNEDNIFSKRDMGGINFMMEHKINSKLSYSNTTAFRIYQLKERYDLDGTYRPIFSADEIQKGLQFSEEVRFHYDNNNNLSAFVGASYMFDRNKHTIEMNTNLKYSFQYLVRPTLQSIMNSLPDEIIKGVDDALDQVMSGYYKMLPQYANAMMSVVDKVKVVMSEKIKTQLADEYSNMINQSQWEITPDIYGKTTSIVYDIMVDALKDVFASEPSADAFTQYIDPVTVVEGLGLQRVFSNLQQYSNLEMKDNYQENETDENIYHEADIFADATYKITDNLSFTLGLRGTIEQQRTSYLSTSDEAPLVGAFVYHGTNGTNYWLHDLEISWVGRAVLSYLFVKNNNAYISFSKGRRPGSIYYNFNIKEAVKLQPETSLNYELGFKGSLVKNHINYTMAGYYYDWLHFQSSVSTAGINGIRKYVNTDKGKANAMGFEASIETYFNNFAFFADYSYIDAKFTDKDSDDKPQELAGHRFRMTPQNTLDFGFDISYPILNKFLLYFRPSYSWMSDMYFSTDNTEELSQKAYGIANFSLGVNWTLNRVTFDLSFYGKNVLDEQYIIDAGNMGQMWGCPTFIAGAPSMYGVSLKLGFK